MEQEGKNGRELRGDRSCWLHGLSHKITMVAVSLLKLHALLTQESSQPADLGLFSNIGCHGGRIKQYDCTPHGCTVLEGVDHSRLEDAEVYRVMTPPGLRLCHSTPQWRVRACLPVCSHVPFLKGFSSATEVALGTKWVPSVTALTASGDTQ